MIVAGCRRGYWLALLMAGCGAQSHTLFGEDSGTETLDASDIVEEGDDAGGGPPPGCSDDTSRVPSSLECTGLYSNLANKTVAKSALPFTPAWPLWSDGAEKHRWVSLPPDTQIDNSSPNNWVFPVGTKFWKEFRVGGKRVETRLFWKVRSDLWRKGTYAWNADETEAKLHFGGDIKLANGDPYHLPEQGECDDCHKGQTDRSLGFGAVNLGLDGASGVTLEWLADEGWLTEKPAKVKLSIGADRAGLDDDGVPLAAKALAVLHTNCGVSCHNDTPDRKANLTGQNLRLDAKQLDGRAPDETWPAFATAVGKLTEGAQLGGTFTRIAPGDPATSHVVTLMKTRTPGRFAGPGQMPPIASRLVDTEGLAIVTKWISRLPGGSMDAGATDAGMDATMPEAAMPEAAMPEADVPDSGMPDADSMMDAGTDAGMDAGDGAVIDAEQVDADAVTPDAESGPDAEEPDAEAGTPEAL